MKNETSQCKTYNTPACTIVLGMQYHRYKNIAIAWYAVAQLPLESLYQFIRIVKSWHLLKPLIKQGNHLVLVRTKN